MKKERKQMEKINNKLIFLLITIIGMILILSSKSSVKAGAAYIEDYGDISQSGNVTAYLEDDYTLVIAGQGKMKDYTKASDLPWYNERAQIKSVFIGSSIENIGTNAFKECTNISTVTIPPSVKSIDDSSFESSIDTNKITLKCVENSYAYQYAQKKGYSITKLYQTTIFYMDNANGDKVENMPEQQTKIESYEIKLSDKEPTRVGYAFMGWSTHASTRVEDVEYEPGDMYYDTLGLVLYAIWEDRRIDIDSEDITSSFDKNEYIYTGKEIKPILTIRNGDTVLKEKIDYTLEYIDNINVGKATIEINGIGNYIGTTSVYFTIREDYVVSVKIKKEPDRKVYKVRDYNEQVDLSGGILLLNMASGATKELPMNDEKVTIEYYNFDKLGETNIEIHYDDKHRDNYVDYEKNYIVYYKVTIADYTTEIKLNYCRDKYNWGESLDGTIFEHLGSWHTMVYMLTDDKITVEGYDPYKIGEQEVTIKYKDFTTTVTVTVFDYVASIEVKKEPTKMTYKMLDGHIDLTGGIIQLNMISGDKKEIPMKGNVSVYYGFHKVVGINEVTIEYEEHNELQTLNHSRPFYLFQTILKVNFEDCIQWCDVKGNMRTTYKYGDNIDLSGIKIIVHMASGNETELEPTEKNIKITGYDRYKLGLQTIVVTYINDSQEYQIKPYNINVNPINVSELTIKGITNKEYTGKSIKQKIEVWYKDRKLKEGEDYKVEYGNNKEIGTTSICILGKGISTGSVVKQYNIVPKKVNGVKAESQSTTSIKLSWSKVTGISKYQLYKYNASKKKWEKVVATNKTSYTIKKLKAGTTYKFRVRAYKTVGNKNYCGAYSATLETATKTSTPKILKITSKSKKATINWKKVSGASGYGIYMATSKKGKYSKVKTISSGKTVKYTKSSLKKKKTYYFKIRTYKKVNGKKIYSSYSTVKSIKVK